MAFVDQIFETNSSQEIAISYSQLPEFVKEHKYTKEKLSHRDKQQLSDWRVLKNVNDTLKELQNDPSEEAYKQRCIILASATCPRYGVPQVQETRRVIEEAKQLKRNLFTGAQLNLNLLCVKRKKYTQ